MEVDRKTLRAVRLEVALAICSSSGGDLVAKQKIVKGLCDSDPVIAKILKKYGVEVVAN